MCGEKNMKCPICGSEKVVVNQKLELKNSEARKIYLQGICKKCNVPLVIEYTPTSARQLTTE